MNKFKWYVSGIGMVFVLVVAPSRAQTYSTQVIQATANIFGAGTNSTPNPGGGTGGTIASNFLLNPGIGRILTFSSVVSNSNSMTPGIITVPDGLQADGTPAFGINLNINSYQGISGMRLEQGSGFLVGVFLDNAPTNSAPARLEFTNNGTPGLIATSFGSLAPALQQNFFIGDGLTGNGMGSVQQFLIPDTATRLFLGFADAGGYSGNPGHYEDNSGSITVSFSSSASAAPEPGTLGLLALGMLGGMLVRRQKGQWA